MNKDVKAKWVAALRSGKYPQMRWSLCEDGKHCGNGVLAEVAVTEGVVVKREYIHMDIVYGMYGTEAELLGSNIWLPDEVIEWAELDHDQVDKVQHLNDAEFYSLAGIADWVEVNL